MEIFQWWGFLGDKAMNSDGVWWVLQGRCQGMFVRGCLSGDCPYLIDTFGFGARDHVNSLAAMRIANCFGECDARERPAPSANIRWWHLHCVTPRAVLSHGHNLSYVQVLASACCLRVKTWENVGKICGSARGEYGLSTDLGARRHAVEILVHAELSLRSGYGFTPSTDDAGTSTANVCTTYSLREFFTIFPMVTCSIDGVLSTCVVRAWSVRGPCLLRTSQVQLSNEQTELTWTVPSKHVLRTYNALISAVEQVTVGKGDHGKNLCLWRTISSRKVVHIYPHADIGRTNSHSSHLHALTTCEWVRTPCVSSTCKYDPRTITWKSHGDRTF